MRGFTLIRYSGDDAGDVLATLVLGGTVEEADTHEIETKTQIGFVPNPEQEEEDSDDETDD